MPVAGWLSILGLVTGGALTEGVFMQEAFMGGAYLTLLICLIVSRLIDVRTTWACKKIARFYWEISTTIYT
jgi:hypothetical protein